MPAGVGRGKCNQTGQTTGGWDAERFLALPDERALSETERLWHMPGGGIIFQRAETDDGVNTDFAPTEPTAGRSRLQGAGLHSPALEYLEGVRLRNSHLLVLSNQPGSRVIVWRLYPIATDEGMPYVIRNERMLDRFCHRTDDKKHEQRVYN